MLKQEDVARYGPTPRCEACTALAEGAQRVTEPHADDGRRRMDEIMQRDEDALVEQRLHADRLRRGPDGQLMRGRLLRRKRWLGRIY